MEQLLLFEQNLYEDECIKMPPDINDVEFLVDRITQLPSLRPLILERAVAFCQKYMKNPLFHTLFLNKSLKRCPVLLHRVFVIGGFKFEEIVDELRDCFIGCYYFRKEIDDFGQFLENVSKPFFFDMSFLEKEEEIDLMILYGFIPNSVEYCLKYDDVDSFRGLLNGILQSKKFGIKWSPFEWSRKPSSFDYLSFAGFYGSINCFRLLLMNGYTIFDHTRSLVVCCGNSDLFHICNEGFTSFSSHLLIASEYNRLSIIRYLIDQGTDLNAQNLAGNTSLHIAAEYGHLQIVNCLIDSGALVDSRNSNSWTPLHSAVKEGHICIVKYLIEKGADVNAKNGSLWTPLHSAVFNGYSDIVDYLIKKGARINEISDSDWIALHWATYDCNEKLIHCLIENGSKINAPDNKGMTPFHYSVFKGNLEIIKFLHNNGADIDIKANDNKTPLHWAVIKGQLSITEYLIQNGADINAKDNDGFTPLYYSSRYPIISKYLKQKGGIE